MTVCDWPVTFTGNGVISRGKFYPYRYVHTDKTYLTVDPSSNQVYLALRSIKLRVGVIPGAAQAHYNVESTIDGKYQSFDDWAVVANAVGGINVQYMKTAFYDIVFDKGVVIEFNEVVAAASFDVWVCYAELDEPEQKVEYIDGTVQPCDLWSWIKGECIHGSIG